MTKYEILTLISQFLGAAGTLFAVIVALYLARKDRRIDLEIYSGIYTIHSDEHGIIGEIIKFGIINRGRNPVHIANLSWSIGIIGKLKALQLFDQGSRLNSPLPIILKEAETADYSIPMEIFERGIAKMGKEMENRIFINNKNFFKISVNIFGHKSRQVPVDKAIRKLIIKKLKTIKTS